MRRAVTRAQRNFGPLELAQLPRDRLRTITQALLMFELGAVESFRSQGDFDEFDITYPGLWRARRARVRIYYRAVTQADVAAAHEFASSENMQEVHLLATESGETLALTAGVTVIPPTSFAAAIEGSFLVEWGDAGPDISVSRLDLAMQLADQRLVDTLGIGWLPILALNELPTELDDGSEEPQDLLERLAFKIFTAVFRFGGERYGERRRGERYPDAVLTLPGRPGVAAMLDCKAASSGYVMPADHFLRFVRYWEELEPNQSSNGIDLRYLVIVSSHFPGSEGDRHPFHSRAEDLIEETGLQLVYVNASDISLLAANLEASEVTPMDRERLDWQSSFETGQVDFADLRGMLGTVAVR